MIKRFEVLGYKGAKLEFINNDTTFNDSREGDIK